MRDNEKPFGYWVQDSGGRQSFHENQPNLTYDQSFRGSLSFTQDEKGNRVWTALDKNGKELGSGTLNHTRNLVETHVRKNAHKDITYKPAEKK